MSIKKKSLLFILAALLTMNMIAVGALATDVPAEAPTNDVVMAPRAEETEWIIRNNNGVYQKRLWSITYGVWRTEWINC